MDWNTLLQYFATWYGRDILDAVQRWISPRRVIGLVAIAFGSFFQLVVALIMWRIVIPFGPYILSAFWNSSITNPASIPIWLIDLVGAPMLWIIMPQMLAIILFVNGIRSIVPSASWLGLLVRTRFYVHDEKATRFAIRGLSIESPFWKKVYKWHNENRASVGFILIGASFASIYLAMTGFLYPPLDLFGLPAFPLCLVLLIVGYLWLRY